MKLGERLVHRLKSTIENFGVKIPPQTGPISKVIKGRGQILPRPEAETLRAFGTGPRRAVMRFAVNHPERVVNALNPKEEERQALSDPGAAEMAFHQQLAQKLRENWRPGDFIDSSISIEERELGFIPYQPDDRRIKNLEAAYKIKIGPKILVQKGKPVSVFDYVRPDDKVFGSALVPVETASRPVYVPDIAGVLGRKNAGDVIALLGLVDSTRGEAVSSRQAQVRQAVVDAVGKQAMGLTPELVTFTVQAFLSAAESPESPAKTVVSSLLKPKK